MYRILQIAVLIGISSSAISQQLTISSLYDLQGTLHNPSVVGVGSRTSFGTSYRSMWNGIDASPRTMLIFGSTSINKGRVGIGAYVYNDVTGPTSRKGIQSAYAYHIPLANNAFFSVGLEARVLQFSVDKSMIQASLGNDPIMAGAGTTIKGDAGLGFSYTGRKLQLGGAVSQLVQSKLNLYSGTLSRTEEARLYRHFYLNGSYSWQVDEHTRIIPNLIFIYLPNTPLETQGGFRVEHRELFWWGLSLRARQSWMISAGLNIHKKFMLGYSFDIYSTPLSLFYKGPNAHEMVIKYAMQKNN